MISILFTNTTIEYDYKYERNTTSYVWYNRYNRYVYTAFLCMLYIYSSLCHPGFRLISKIDYNLRFECKQLYAWIIFSWVYSRTCFNLLHEYSYYPPCQRVTEYSHKGLDLNGIIYKFFAMSSTLLCRSVKYIWTLECDHLYI